jgi:outer membrane protein
MDARSMRQVITRALAGMIGATLLMLGFAATASAQAPQRVAPATLTLEEAVGLARQHNPDIQVQRNAQSASDWAVREAYGSLVPNLSVSTGAQVQAAGTPVFGLITSEDLGIARTPQYYSSNYGINMNMQLSGATFFRMAQQRSNREATRARVGAAEYTLTTDITRQYLAAVRARDGVTLAEQELATATEALRLADARVQAGAATRLDAAQAEVDHGRARVGLLQARHQYESQKVTLLQRIGIELDRDVELTSAFQVFEPHWSREELLAEAMSQHPQLRAARASEGAERASARAARMSYLPTLSAQASWSGYTRQAGDSDFLIAQARNSALARLENCEFLNRVSSGLSQPLPDYPQNCGRHELTPVQEAQIVARNNTFPFSYTQQPATFSVALSLPIMNGFTRERTVQTAQIAASDAQERRRGEELALRARVTNTLLALETAYATVAIEAQNAAAAAEQLELARERYRLGAGSILELTQAQGQKANADQRHLAAVYNFHENLADLESAVGRRLR